MRRTGREDAQPTRRRRGRLGRARQPRPPANLRQPDLRERRTHAQLRWAVGPPCRSVPTATRSRRSHRARRCRRRAHSGMRKPSCVQNGGAGASVCSTKAAYSSLLTGRSATRNGARVTECAGRSSRRWSSAPMMNVPPASSTRLPVLSAVSAVMRAVYRRAGFVRACRIREVGRLALQSIHDVTEFHSSSE